MIFNRDRIEILEQRVAELEAQVAVLSIRKTPSDNIKKFVSGTLHYRQGFMSISKMVELLSEKFSIEADRAMEYLRELDLSDEIHLVESEDTVMNTAVYIQNYMRK